MWGLSVSMLYSHSHFAVYIHILQFVVNQVVTWLAPAHCVKVLLQVVTATAKMLASMMSTIDSSAAMSLL